MAIDRRTFVTLLGASLASLATSHRSVMTGLAADGSVSDDLFIAACKLPSLGHFGLGVVAEASARGVWTHDVEARLHGGAVRPGSHELAVIGRRPGKLALVLDVRDGTVMHTLPARDDRYYLGHASFDAAGERLFVAEAESSTAQGRTGVYDVRAGYRRIGEWATLGTDPHELILAADGCSVWVANGGVELHPDTGRTILNENGIVSTLVELDLEGRVRRQISLPDDFASVSLRHIALAADGGIVIGCQDQGDPDVGLPIVWHVDRDGRVRPLAEAAPEWISLKGYIGSVAVDASGRTVLATSPRGNRAIALSLDTPDRWAELSAFDVGGVAALREAGRFLLTTGGGTAMDVAVQADGSLAVERSRSVMVQWDNHIIAARGRRSA